MLDLAFFGVRARWIAALSPLRSAWPGHCAWLSSARGNFVLYRSRGRHPKPLFRFARPCRCARFCLLQLTYELECRSRGETLQDPLLCCARPGLAAALGFPLHVGVLCCIVVEGDTLNPLFAALGLATAIGLASAFGWAFFGVRASWITLVCGGGGGGGGVEPSPLVFLCLLACCVVS